MQDCYLLGEQCTLVMEQSPPPLYSPPLLSADDVASCESVALYISAAAAVESASSVVADNMPPLETSKMGGLGPNTAAAVNSSGMNNNGVGNGLADPHHHLLLAAVGGVAAAAATKKSFSEQTDSELAELATQEISLDLQGLIDDTHFADENLFGDLMETAKKNEVGAGGTSPQSSWLAMARVATPGSSSGGSSGQNSPGSEGQNSPTSSYGYHNHHLQHQQASSRGAAALAYLPGSVHSGASFGQLGGGSHVAQQQQQQQPQQHHHHHHHQNIQVKQEPLEAEFPSACAQQQVTAAAAAYPAYPVVSSSTHLTDHGHQGSPPTPLPYSMGGPLPSLKSFAQQPKYLTKKKSGGDKSSDEYRRRRERNNVAVRKSREKAKMRSRETEERVKILARENDRLQKKVELLQEELSVLRSLFTSVGVLPDHVHRELAKHLDNFQAQHAAINY